MSSTTITITMFNGTNYANWVSEMAQLIKQKQVYGIIKGYNDKPEKLAANMKATEQSTFRDWMDYHGVARLTIIVGMKSRNNTNLHDSKHWEDAFGAAQISIKVKLVAQHLWDNSISWEHLSTATGRYRQLRITNHFGNHGSNLSAAQTATFTTDSCADTDTAKTIANTGKQNDIFYLICGIPRHNECNIFLEVMINKNDTITTMPDNTFTKLVTLEATMKLQYRVAPDALFIAKKGDKGSNGGKGPTRDKWDNKDNRKEKNQHNGYHWQPTGHIPENCMNKQRSNPPKALYSAPKASTETLATFTPMTLIENYSITANSYALCSDGFIDCRCLTHISNHWSMFVTCTDNSSTINKLNGYDEVILFATGYGHAKLICTLQDGKTVMIILPEVRHLLVSFHLLSVSD